jgi:hypothetical protein
MGSDSDNVGRCTVVLGSIGMLFVASARRLHGVFPILLPMATSRCAQRVHGVFPEFSNAPRDKINGLGLWSAHHAVLFPSAR